MNTYRVICTLIVAGVVCAGEVLAQQPAAGSDGRALDANLQSGTGSVNAPSRRMRPGAYQDALITGNVGGLHRFRGNIDYRAPGEFTDRLGSDDTYNFRLESLQSTRRGYTNPAIRSSQDRYLVRSSTGLTSGEVARQSTILGGLRTQAPRSDVGGLTVRRDYSREAEGVEAGRVRPVLNVPQYIAKDETGRSLDIYSSPLVGLRAGQVMQPRDPDALEEKANAEDATEDTLRNNQALPPRVYLGTPLAPTGRDPQTRSTAEPESRAEWVERMRRGAPSPHKYGPQLPEGIDRLATSGAPDREPSNVYGDQLGGNPENPYPARPSPLTPRETTFARGERPGAVTDVDRMNYRRLTANLGGTMRLDTLVSGSGSDFDHAMARGEQYLSAARYFQAEERFTQAATMPGATPLALVGLVHARIGAGLSTSAGESLRRLLLRYPELIRARYGFPALPSSDGLTHALSDIQQFFTTKPDSDAALLGAYIQFQRGETDATEIWLDRMDESAPNDPLVPLLRRAWAVPSDTPPNEESRSEPEPK